jgi:DNA-binding MarR family transcriptional regulator
MEPAELACLCATSRMATRVLTRRYDEALRPYGLRTTQYSILARLDDEGSMTVGRLAGRLAAERTTLSRELGPLGRRGLVEVAAGDDRRRRVVTLTAAGGEALAGARPAWKAVQAQTRDELGGETADRLLADLRTVTAL